MLGGWELLILISAMTVIVLLMRWVFTPGGGIIPRKPLHIGPADYGLLVPAVTARSQEDGAASVATLGEHGIRATLTRNDDGALEVRVFPDDLDRARALLA